MGLEKELISSDFIDPSELIVASHSRKLLSTIQQKGWWSIRYVQLLNVLKSQHINSIDVIERNVILEEWSTYCDGICIDQQGLQEKIYLKYKKEEETKKKKEIKKEKKEKKEIEKQKTNIHPVVKSAKLCGLKIYVRSTSSNTYLNDGGEYEVAQNVTYLCQGVDGIVCTSNAIKHV